jgi:hypothetical protein
MASLHATGNPLTKRPPPGPLWWLHFLKCGTSFGSTLHEQILRASLLKAASFEMRMHGERMHEQILGASLLKAASFEMRMHGDRMHEHAYLGWDRLLTCV